MVIKLRINQRSVGRDGLCILRPRFSATKEFELTIRRPFSFELSVNSEANIMNGQPRARVHYGRRVLAFPFCWLGAYRVACAVHYLMVANRGKGYMGSDAPLVTDSPLCRALCRPTLRKGSNVRSI